jgi:hypothetical protein
MQQLLLEMVSSGLGILVEAGSVSQNVQMSDLAQQSGFFSLGIPAKVLVPASQELSKPSRHEGPLVDNVTATHLGQ